jgi:nucleotide-binding universal stress UspA family protein
MEVQPGSSVFIPKTVIYAADFSLCSENAGPYAALLATQFNAEFLIAHAFVLSQSAMELEAANSRGSKSLQRLDLETALQEASQRFGSNALRPHTLLLEGDPRQVIPELAEKRAPSIVVLGTSGRGMIERGFVGSVAERILRANNGPSFTVGPQVHPLRPELPAFRRVLYATGLSTAAAQGARYAISIAKAFNASIEVLHVAREEDVKQPEQLNALQQRFGEVLDGIVPEQARTLSEPSAVIELGRAHERILTHIQETSADLLVLSIRRSSHLWLQSRLSGAFNIISNAPCPVLTITG